MSAPAEMLALVPALPCDAEGPVFREPWEAQAFALAIDAHARGLFSWPEWAAELSAQIKAAQSEEGGGLMAGVSDMLFGSSGPRGGKRDGVAQLVVKSAVRTVGSAIGREIVRGVLGGLLGGGGRRR